MDEHVLERGRKVRDARAIGKSVAEADNKAVARSNHVADGHADGVADAASNVSSHDKGAVGIAKRAAHDRGANCAADAIPVRAAFGGAIVEGAIGSADSLADAARGFVGRRGAIEGDTARFRCRYWRRCCHRRRVEDARDNGGGGGGYNRRRGCIRAHRRRRRALRGVCGLLAQVARQAPARQDFCGTLCSDRTPCIAQPWGWVLIFA